jgi:hypothetical protein
MAAKPSPLKPGPEARLAALGAAIGLEHEHGPCIDPNADLDALTRHVAFPDARRDRRVEPLNRHLDKADIAQEARVEDAAWHPLARREQLHAELPHADYGIFAILNAAGEEAPEHRVGALLLDACQNFVQIGERARGESMSFGAR